MRRKRLQKFRAYLKCKYVTLETSRAGNSVFVVYFEDVLQRQYRHYISFNSRSKVWINQLLLGSGIKPDFDYLQTCLMIPLLARDTKPFEFCKDRIYQVEYDNQVKGKKGNCYNTVNKIYSMEIGWKKDAPEKLFRENVQVEVF